MKALFLIFHGFHAANGISKKIHYQVQAFEANGLETHLCYLSDEHGIKRRMIDQDVLAYYGGGLKGKLYKRFEFHTIAQYAIKNQIDLVYIRSDHNANPFTIDCVRKIKKQVYTSSWKFRPTVRSRIHFVFPKNTIIY